jgi:hypothetical protein
MRLCSPLRTLARFTTTIATGDAALAGERFIQTLGQLTEGGRSTPQLLILFGQVLYGGQTILQAFSFSIVCHTAPSRNTDDASKSRTASVSPLISFVPCAVYA